MERASLWRLDGPGFQRPLRRVADTGLGRSLADGGSGRGNFFSEVVLDIISFGG
jgi:hypothetical protein